MKKKVRIDSLPKADSGLSVSRGLKSGLGLNSKVTPWSMTPGKMAKPDVKVNSTLQPVPREFANLEAEEGEVATVPGQGGVPSTFKIGGNKHTSGGTPLNLPPDSFIYSDTKNMRIKDTDILAQFGITSKGPHTPADIAKKYDINKYKKVLADPDTDKLQRSTAEGMIANYNLKLAKLALLQESIKGFPQGIPVVAMPYIESMQINPAEFIQMNPQGGMDVQPNSDQMNYGGVKTFKNGGASSINYFQEGGSNIVVQPRRSDRVVLNPKTGEYEVFNAVGKKVGVMNVPTPPPAVNPAGSPVVASTTIVKKSSIPEGSIVVKRSDYKTDIEYNTARNKAFNDNPGKEIYTQNTDGQYSRVAQQKQVLNTDQHINIITSNFSDPKMQQALYDRTLAAAQDPKNRGRNMGFTVDELKSMTPTDLTNQFVEMQTRNLKTNELLHKSGISYDCFDNTTGKLKSTAPCKDSPYKSLDDVFAATGVGSPDDKFKGIQQASYIGYRDLLEDNRKGKITDPELSMSLQPFRIQQRGVQDETGVDLDKDISKIDTYYTNTTSGQIAGINENVFTEVGISPEEVAIKSDPITQAEHLPPGTPPQPGSPWWLQDIVKTAHAAGNLARIKKYQPWQATPDVVTPEMTFYDPTRELAANAEQSNIAGNILAQFTGPQSFNARNAQIQGQALKNAADVLSRYNNQNVTVSNQQAAQNAGIMNQASQQKAQLATNLWDKYQTVNQQFDNAKSEARDALVNQYVSAITNKNYTANLNKMYPQFAVNPAIGGEYYFHDPRALKPDFSQSPDIGKVYEQVLEEHPTLKDNPVLAYKMASQMMGLPATNDDEWLQYQSNKGVIPQYPQ